MAAKTGVTYIAQKRLRVGDGYRMPGEKVPEAAAWMNVDAYVNRGMLAVVPDEGSESIETRSQRGLRDAGGTAPRQRLVPKRFVDVVIVDEDERTPEELHDAAEELGIEDHEDMDDDELLAAVHEAEAELDDDESDEDETEDPDEEEEEEDETPDVVVPEEEADTEGPGATDLDYDDMSIAEVKQAYADGLLDIETIDELEEQRAKGRREGIDSWLDSLEEDEDEGEEE